MIIHNINPVLFDFGFIQIRWYSIAYILGITLGWLYANLIIKYLIKKFNFRKIVEPNLDELIVYLILGIIVGGRLGYVLFYNFEYYIKNFSEIIQIWKGGMSFHGGLVGVIIASFFYAKFKKNNFLNITDILACVSPIGLFFGRIANFINGELYGKASSLPWSIIFPIGGNISRHPSQIYEAILEGLLLFFLLNYFAFKKQIILSTGKMSAFFLIFYSLLRMTGEVFREPDMRVHFFYNLSMGSFLSICMLVVGLGIIIFYGKKN